MNISRRSFLSSLPFIPSALKAIIASPVVNPAWETATHHVHFATHSSSLDDINQYFAASAARMQRQILANVARENPFMKLLDENRG